MSPVVNRSKSPSKKHEKDPTFTPSTSTQHDISLAVAAAQRRILPSRAKRGGLAIGSGEVDQMILNAQRQAVSNQPIIPSSTRFLLTTDSSMVPPPSEDDSAPDLSLYFQRPEVIQSYQRQAVIQTPAFEALPETATVSGRLRIRPGEETAVDLTTSDEAYLRRHRKYETFEKRQRRREKEKLVHEHYKLRERIDQLRTMDATAFLPPNGGTLQEAEQRRKEMIETAEQLEQRYNLLLPVENRKAIAQRRATERQQSVFDPDIPFSPASGYGPAKNYAGRLPTPAPARVRTKERLKDKEKDSDRTVVPGIDGELPMEVDEPTLTTTESRTETPPEKYARRSPAKNGSPEKDSTKIMLKVKPLKPHRTAQSLPGSIVAAAFGAPPRASTVAPSFARLRATSTAPAAGLRAASASPQRGRGRGRRAVTAAPPNARAAQQNARAASPPSLLPSPSNSRESSPARRAAVAPLLHLAKRTAQTLRKTGRTVQPFAYPVPPRADEIRDTYELPPWLFSDDGGYNQSEHGAPNFSEEGTGPDPAAPPRPKARGARQSRGGRNQETPQQPVEETGQAQNAVESPSKESAVTVHEPQQHEPPEPQNLEDAQEEPAPEFQSHKYTVQFEIDEDGK